MPKFLKSVKIIHYYSLLCIRVLRRDLPMHRICARCIPLQELSLLLLLHVRGLRDRLRVEGVKPRLQIKSPVEKGNCKVTKIGNVMITLKVTELRKVKQDTTLCMMKCLDCS